MRTEYSDAGARLLWGYEPPQINDGEIEIGGGGGPELLWTNPSPSASFGAQTVTVPKRDWYLIRYSHTAATAVNTQIIKYGEDSILPIVISTSNNRNGTRHATSSEAGIAFTVCTYNGTTTNSYAVPLEIYGL